MHVYSLFVAAILLFTLAKAQYNVQDTSDCVFPFLYNGKNYTTCYDKDRKHPWCSLTPRFRGAWKYCQDTTKTNWVCNTKCYDDDEYPFCYTKNNQQLFCLDKIKSINLNVKPEAHCRPEFLNISKVHTACLAPLTNVAKFGVSEAEKKEIVDLHNKWRRDVPMMASAMMKMYWDDDLAYVAQKHASRCSFYHDDMALRALPGTGKFPGQNIVMTTGQTRLNWTYAFDEMYAGEMKRWVYGQGIKKEFTGKTAYHYTQAIVEHISRVGCGYAECVFFDRVEKLYVCNYDSLQKANEVIIPYKKGLPCDLCPDSCSNRLCDCKGRQCFNGGELDPNTCKCVCNGLWNGDDCSSPIVPLLNVTTGCYFPFVYHGVLYYKCAPSDGFEFCPKQPEVDESTEIVECEGSKRRKRRDLENSEVTLQQQYSDNVVERRELNGDMINQQDLLSMLEKSFASNGPPVPVVDAPIETRAASVKSDSVSRKRNKKKKVGGKSLASAIVPDPLDTFSFN